MNAYSAPAQASEVLNHYKSRIERLEILIVASRSRKFLALAASLACTAALVIALIVALKGASFLFAALPILLIVAIWQFQTFSRCSAKIIDSARRSAFMNEASAGSKTTGAGKGTPDWNSPASIIYTNLTWTF